MVRCIVATVLTACDIETQLVLGRFLQLCYCIVATVLTACGIETQLRCYLFGYQQLVATVLTVYGIETKRFWIVRKVSRWSCNSTYRLRY